MKLRSTTKGLVKHSWDEMAHVVQRAIASLRERHGCTKLQILSYIKANNPRLAYPNTHNLVLYLQRIINDGIDDRSLREHKGKYKLVSKKHRTLNKAGRNITERSKPADRESRSQRPRSLSLTSIGVGSHAGSEEPQDRKRHGKSRRKGHKGKRRGSRRRRRRSYVASHAASQPASVETEPVQVPSNDVQASTSEKELSNPESDDNNLSSNDECNSGSAPSSS